ncbi:MAG: hypothetical protein LBS50_07445 [Prevotellaceae bacterium]|jgi:hypothetical protein|nr:hypothetical protein [Prevotellaceae bacterium]
MKTKITLLLVLGLLAANAQARVVPFESYDDYYQSENSLPSTKTLNSENPFSNNNTPFSPENSLNGGSRMKDAGDLICAEWEDENFTNCKTWCIDDGNGFCVGGSENPNCAAVDGCPVGSGIGIFLLLFAGYGFMKYRKSRKQKVELSIIA